MSETHCHDERNYRRDYSDLARRRIGFSIVFRVHLLLNERMGVNIRIYVWIVSCMGIFCMLACSCFFQ